MLHPALGRRHPQRALGQRQGRAVEPRRASMLGQAGVYDDIPYFYTDQYDLGMEYSGYAPLTVGRPVVYRGDVAAREFIAFWVADERVVAGMNVNVWDVNEQVQRTDPRGRRPSISTKLADASVPLEDL